MPKLKNRPPKYSKMNKYAVVYHNGRPRYLGPYGSPESKVAYSRFIAELQAAPAVPQPAGEKPLPSVSLPSHFLTMRGATLTARSLDTFERLPWISWTNFTETISLSMTSSPDA